MSIPAVLNVIFSFRIIHLENIECSIYPPFLGFLIYNNVSENAFSTSIIHNETAFIVRILTIIAQKCSRRMNLLSKKNSFSS